MLTLNTQVVRAACQDEDVVEEAVWDDKLDGPYTKET